MAARLVLSTLMTTGDLVLVHSASAANGELTGGPGNLGSLGPRFALARNEFCVDKGPISLEP